MTLLAIRQCQRLAIHVGMELRTEVEARACFRHRVVLTGHAYLSHAAGCGRVTAAERAAEAWTKFTETDRERALVLVTLGWYGRKHERKLR